uniref:Ig-like domain-containing protein n=1 Tax=Hippocampus comes TaxID=109280 RepID=A0A3Q3DTX2_HIPCM
YVWLVSAHDTFYDWFIKIILGLAHVSGIEIYAPSEVEAVNGTTVKLKCTFRSSHPVSTQSVIVSWNFRPLNSKREESVGTNRIPLKTRSMVTLCGL